MSRIVETEAISAQTNLFHPHTTRIGAQQRGKHKTGIRVFEFDLAFKKGIFEETELILKYLKSLVKVDKSLDAENL